MGPSGPPLMHLSMLSVKRWSSLQGCILENEHLGSSLWGKACIWRKILRLILREIGAVFCCCFVLGNKHKHFGNLVWENKSTLTHLFLTPHVIQFEWRITRNAYVSKLEMLVTEYKVYWIACFWIFFFLPDGDSIHVCKPCKDGYIQPSNNTADKCYLLPSKDVKLPDEDNFTSPKPQEDQTTPGKLPSLHLKDQPNADFTQDLCSCRLGLKFLKFSSYWGGTSPQTPSFETRKSIVYKYERENFPGKLYPTKLVIIKDTDIVRPT